MKEIFVIIAGSVVVGAYLGGVVGVYVGSVVGAYLVYKIAKYRERRMQMICPYCFSDLSLSSDLSKCDVCHKKISKRIKQNITSKDVSISLLGNRKVGKTTYLSILFYLIETKLFKFNINYEYLDDEGFKYILDNVTALKNGEKITATSLNFDTLLITLFRNFYFDKFICSFLDTPGEIAENIEYLENLELSKKLFKSENIFLLIDSENFFKEDDILYTGFVSRYLNFSENIKNQNIYLIFTKADKIFNYCYKYPALEKYINFDKQIFTNSNLDLNSLYEELDIFSNETKNFIKKENKKVNFFNLLESNFKNVECFLVSALGDNEKYKEDRSFGVINPLIHAIGRKYRY